MEMNEMRRVMIAAKRERSGGDSLLEIFGVEFQ